MFFSASSITPVNFDEMDDLGNNRISEVMSPLPSVSEAACPAADVRSRGRIGAIWPSRRADICNARQRDQALGHHGDISRRHARAKPSRRAQEQVAIAC